MSEKRFDVITFYYLFLRLSGSIDDKKANQKGEEMLGSAVKHL